MILKNLVIDMKSQFFATPESCKKLILLSNRYAFFIFFATIKQLFYSEIFVMILITYNSFATLERYFNESTRFLFNFLLSAVAKSEKNLVCH